MRTMKPPIASQGMIGVAAVVAFRTSSILGVGAVTLGLLGVCVFPHRPANGQQRAAATYVVDQNHPQASDTNPGTEEKPWKTIRQAAQSAQPGDTVYVMEGRYDERVELSVSGTPQAWITFKSAPRHRAVTKGFGTGKASYIRIQGFRVTGDKPQVWPNPYFGGLYVTSDHIEFTDNFISELTCGIWGSGKHVRVACNKLYKCQYGILLSGGAGGRYPVSEQWVVERNEIERVYKHFDSDCDYTRPHGKGHILRHNYLHGTRRDKGPGGVNEVGDAHLDFFQVFDNNKDIAQDSVIEENVGFDSSQVADLESYHYPDLKCCGRLTFRKNIFGFQGSNGTNLKGLYQTTVENNTFYSLQWFAIHFYHGNQSSVARANIVSTVYSVVHADADSKDKGNQADYNLGFVYKSWDLTGPNDKKSVDPMFVDPESRNFRLKKGSPAIAAGPEGATLGALEYPNVYYVDREHPGASDQGFGYPGWPYKTIGKALSVAEQGETVVVRGGAYRETIVPKAGVTIRAMKDEQVVISGADLVEGWKREGKKWSAPLATKPTKLLRDGQPFSDFTYDEGSKRITVQGGDPRLHFLETVVRKDAIDLAGKTGIKMEGIETADTVK